MNCTSENEVLVAEILNWRVHKLILHPQAQVSLGVVRRLPKPSILDRKKIRDESVARLPRQQESLHSLAVEHFTGIQIALGVGRLHMDAVELAGVFAHATHGAEDLASLAVEEPYMVVGEIGDIQEFLIFVV